MLHCYNKGCNQLFDPEENTDKSCCHHPGAPFFHDAFKGWSCCNKKSVDFSEFLSIKGCTFGKHSNEKPPAPEKLDTSDKSEVIVNQAPIVEPMARPRIDSPMRRLPIKVADRLKESIDALINKRETSDRSNGEIPIGTSCKNKGCNASYSGTVSDECSCTHHPGVPIFHEGMKYWSCCQKKTTDFAQFLSTVGCATGMHRWLEEKTTKTSLKCNYDWYQTGSQVVLSIYAKKCHYELSRVEVNPIRLHVVLVFPEQDNAEFEIDLELRGVIDVQKATAEMFGTKVEIILPKLELGSWSKLCFPRDSLPAAKKPSDPAQQEEEDGLDDDFSLDDIKPLNNPYANSVPADTK